MIMHNRRYYYWHPSHVEAQTYAFQLYTKDPARCMPSPLASKPEGAPRRVVYLRQPVVDAVIADCDPLDLCQTGRHTG